MEPENSQAKQLKALIDKKQFRGEGCVSYHGRDVLAIMGGMC